MKVYTSIENVSDKPLFLTIGNFDGIHLGHQALLKNLQKGAEKEQILSCVITFSNHPTTILHPNHPKPLITSKEHKLKLLEDMGIDLVFLLDFTLPFSRQSAEDFLRSVHALTPFRRLVLGLDAKLGHDRQGNTPLMHQLANDLHFTLEFLSLEIAGNEPISSSRIREAIQNAELTKASKLLGRKYSIVGKVIHGTSGGKKLGYPTLNFSLKELCHPPLGVYAVTVIHHQKKYHAVANVGIAPTLRDDHIPLLEVHLIDQHRDLYGETLEVIFEEFFRPEKTFASSEELKSQIAEDIKQAKSYFNNSASGNSKCTR